MGSPRFTPVLGILVFVEAGLSSPVDDPEAALHGELQAAEHRALEAEALVQENILREDAARDRLEKFTEENKPALEELADTIRDLHALDEAMRARIWTFERFEENLKAELARIEKSEPENRKRQAILKQEIEACQAAARNILDREGFRPRFDRLQEIRARLDPLNPRLRALGREAADARRALQDARTRLEQATASLLRLQAEAPARLASVAPPFLESVEVADGAEGGYRARWVSAESDLADQMRRILEAQDNVREQLKADRDRIGELLKMLVREDQEIQHWLDRYAALIPEETWNSIGMETR